MVDPGALQRGILLINDTDIFLSLQLFKLTAEYQQVISNLATLPFSRLYKVDKCLNCAICIAFTDEGSNILKIHINIFKKVN